MVLITAAPVFSMPAFATWLFLDGEEKRDNSQSFWGREGEKGAVCGVVWGQWNSKRVPPVDLMQEKQGTTPDRSRSWEGPGKTFPWGTHGCSGATGTSSWGSLRPFRDPELAAPNHLSCPVPCTLGFSKQSQIIIGCFGLGWRRP